MLPNASEGYTTDAQRDHIASLIREYAPNAKRIFEIGFNAGHSAEAFLKNHPDATVVSVDIGTHRYVKEGKACIDELYPGRHRLVIGNSMQVVPTEFTNEVFDVIFIDGGHDYEVAKADLRNCRALAHADTLLLMDDTVQDRPEWVRSYNRGPNQAWKEMLIGKKVTELGHENYARGRGMSWGRYNLA